MRTFNLGIVLLFLALMPCGNLAAQTIYKCTTPQGTVFSQRPCGPEAEVRTDRNAGAWSTESAGEIADAVGQVARVSNARGHSLAVYRLASGAVWMRFALSNTARAALDRSFSPNFEIDQLGSEDVGRSRRLHDQGVGIRAFEQDDSSVSFLIWHGREVEGRSVKLKQLMSGKNLNFVFRQEGDQEEVANFSLAGASRSIAQALGISEQVDLAHEERVQAYKKVMVAATNTCFGKPNYLGCMNRGRRCSEQHSGNAEKFLACFEADD